MPDGKKRRMPRKRAARPKASKKGLNKTEKKQVTKLAKKAVNSLAESKYFSTSGGIVSLQPAPIWRTSSAASGYNSEITCYGFTTGFNRSKTPESTSVYKYGVNNVTGAPVSMAALNLNRIFTTSATVTSRRQYAIEGNVIRPSYAECQWLLERPLSNTQTNDDAGLPYAIRMVRARPKSLKGSFQRQDPYTDLFLDQYNEAFGVGSGNLSTDVTFTKDDFYMSKVNNRLYSVIEDKIFTMLPTATSVNLSQDNTEANVVGQPDRSGNRVIKTKHNIGKELYYNEPNIVSSSNEDRQFPDTGFDNEFILFHIIAQGTAPLPVGQEGNIGSAFGITLSARPVSTFKDV
jgi:hypothetical protein